MREEVLVENDGAATGRHQSKLQASIKLSPELFFERILPKQSQIFVMKRKIFLLVAALAPFLTMPVSSIRAAETKAATPDSHFIDKAADADMTEIQLAKIALDNGQKQDVKDFANRMITDHGKANDELKPIAQELNVTLPEKVSAEHQQTIDKLSKLKGDEFDKAYSNAMVNDHKKVVAMFEKSENHIQNTDLKKFAEKTLPTLKEHLQLAEKL